MVLPTGKSLDITSYTTVPLPRTAYRWALVSIMQDLRSSYDPAAVVEELYKWEEWGVVLRAKTYQYTMVTLTYGGLLQTVEVLAGWLVEEPWVCNGIVREGRSRVGTPVGYVSFELV